PTHATSVSLSPSLFLTAPATTALYTLSLHDALPILEAERGFHDRADLAQLQREGRFLERLDHATAPEESEISAHLGGSRILRVRSEEHTSELQSRENLVCRLLLEKKKNTPARRHHIT